MSDLISRADADNRHYIKIYADDEPCVKAEKLYQICGETQNGEVAEWLKEYFPLSYDNWIPVSERLPEEHEWVGTKQFGTTISDKVHITFDVNGERFVKTLCLQNGELSDYEKQSMDAFHKGWRMIAWMPLPTPYREENEE